MDGTQKQNYIENCNFPFCEGVSKYNFIVKVGQGTYGEVWKAKSSTNPKQLFAVKKIIMNNENQGFPITAIREIKILQQLKHENIVELIEICRSQPTQENKFLSTFYLIFEFCEHDLAGLLSNKKINFTVGEIKKVMKMLFEALFFMHQNKLLHRDLKSANILITKTGVLKLADFGLARAFRVTEEKKLTNRVVTLWYRPPELLLGDRNYGPPIDMWGAACVMAEMWIRSPIMQGSTEQMQLNLISQLCGSITPEVWPNVAKLNLYNKIELLKNQKRKVIERLKPYVQNQYACDLLNQLLVLDPNKRINADRALDHDFFWTDPMPTDLRRMLSQQHESMFELHVKRCNGQTKQQHHRHQQHYQQRNVAEVEHGDRIY